MTKGHQTNNFDFIRLVAASLVILSHSYSINDLGSFRISSNLNLGALGVDIFFVISGYLVSQSFLRNASLKAFFAARILRIIPGLIGVLFFSVFIIGPLFTTLPLKDYFTNAETYKYFINVFLIKLHFFLPGVFVNKVLQETVNAPLWTLVYEFSMYMVVALYGIIGLLRKSTLAIVFNLIVLSLCGYVMLFPPTSGYFFLGFNKSIFCIFYVYFFSGVFVTFFIDKLKLNVWFLLLIFLLWFLTLKTFISDLTTVLLVTYAIFYVAYFPGQIGKFITSKGDFSYGLYIYGYVIQNCIHHFVPVMPVWEMFILSMLFTGPFAIASWFLIEKKSLAFKKYLLKRWSGSNELILNNKASESPSMN